MELAEKVSELIKPSESKILYKPFPEYDPTRRRLDISQAKNAVGKDENSNHDLNAKVIGVYKE